MALAQKDSYSLKEVNEIISNCNKRWDIMTDMINELKSYFATKAGDYLRQRLMDSDIKDREFDRGCHQTYANVCDMIGFKLNEAYKKIDEKLEEE